MMDTMATHYRRLVADEEDMELQLPWWTILIVIADLIVFLPVLVYIRYTLQVLFPALASLEHDQPPAYEPVSLSPNDDDDEAANPTDDNTADADEPAVESRRESPAAITSSLRGTHRLLRSSGAGPRVLFRGLACFLAQAFLTRCLVAVFAGALGGAFAPLATLLASLAMVQLAATWVHIAITPAKPLPFWHRMPSFRRAFEATWKPVTLFWFASEIAAWLPRLLAYGMHLELPNVDVTGRPTGMPSEPEDGVKIAGLTFIVLLVSAILGVCVVLPTSVILVRVQASLLPPDEDPIIPFDRSFEGRVQPVIVDGKGYATIADAWHTFSKPAWIRLVKLVVKIALVSLAFSLVLMAVIVPEVFVVLANSTTIQSG